MESSFYFKIEAIEEFLKNDLKEGETLLGIVFTKGHDTWRGELLFPFLRIKDASGVIYLKEPVNLKSAGCPYPPPCR